MMGFTTYNDEFGFQLELQILNDTLKMRSFKVDEALKLIRLVNGDETKSSPTAPTAASKIEGKHESRFETVAPDHIDQTLKCKTRSSRS